MFKVGDQVKLIDDSLDRDLPYGIIGTVVALPGHRADYHRVEFPGYPAGTALVAKEEIELVENRMHFEGGGMREPQNGKARFELLMPTRVPFDQQFLTRCANHLTTGAEKYEERNWEKFSDQAALDRAKASAFRHMVQWLSGETDEDHAAAVFFNLMAAEYVKGRIDGAF